MTEQASATFVIKSWEENPIDETEEGIGLMRAEVSKSYEGDLEGEGRVEYQMMYRDDGSASFVGLERFTGTQAGRKGSFVFEHRGTFEEGVVKSVWHVVLGSGTGKLAGLQGEVAFAAGHADSYPISLDYDFE
ncbi:MAG: DUF3224 domain-containing protein [Thermoanaerobaculia bacterium]